ncbi:MAG: AAA family ATPase [Thaumarchaeota archaeon]|nr:AAA family ATPase [Nitrososphaerota archaeon]
MDRTQHSSKVPKALGVTGTPGTGKKTVSPILASLLDLRLLEINSLAIPYSVPNREGELVVDVEILASELRRREIAGAVVSGHLLADVLKRGDLGFVAVLRCEPAVLKRRLTSRGYPHEKVIENVEAELIGVGLDAAVRRFGATKVHDYDATRAKPALLARTIADDYRGGLPQAEPWRDWILDYDSSTKLRSLLSRPRTEPAST